VSEDTDTADFRKLLAYLKSSRGFDFSSYKPATLQRRVQKRMSVAGVESYGDYQDFLEVHQEEFQHLFNTILINVTSFFRDDEAWSYLADQIIPRLIAISEDGPSDLRVWVAGCASGEEACTVAMLLCEALGREDFRARVKIYATDLDDDALSSSRSATYGEKQVEAVPPELLAKYFEQVGDRYSFDRDLRRSIVFGRHDLIQDAPISRVDLLLCRNTLMYFNAEVQERIISRFNFALNEGGYLFLGKAETLLTHANLFAPLDLKNRVFTKVARGRIRNRSFMFSLSGTEAEDREAKEPKSLAQAAFEHGLTASIVVDAKGLLVQANKKARESFGLNMRDLGRPFQDLEISYRPVELRSGIQEVLTRRHAVHHRDVIWAPPTGNTISFEVRIIPLFDGHGEATGTCITFEDVTVLRRLQTELLSFNQELETAYEEVQSTNEELQTTNEELQSTVEELETTNEELQSTNEELETMNEELQSANEELGTVNEELRLRSLDLNRSNSFLESILESLSDGVIVLDPDQQILSWNHQSEDLWGLRADEAVGKHLFNLDIGLPVESLRAPLRSCLATMKSQEADVPAVSRRGRNIVCRTTFSPLFGPMGEARGVIILTTCEGA
jgi:two-component system CheB/CheR fusion protein